MFLKIFQLNQLRSFMHFSANQEEHLFNTLLEWLFWIAPTNALSGGG